MRLRVAVTGATGHLGGNLVRALLAAGHEVRALVRDDRRAITGLDVAEVPGDVRDPAAVAKLLDGVEVAYHLAAVISISGGLGGLVDAVNVGGTRTVAAACLASGVRRLVHVSSIHAFEPVPLDEPLDETRAPCDRRRAAAYDCSKAGGEREVQAAAARGLDAVIVNPTAVIGPFDCKPSRMGQVILDLARGRLPALVSGAFDWVDGRDVCAGALAAAERGRRGERYLLSGTYLPMTGLAALVAEATGTPAPRLTVPQWAARPVAPLAVAWSRLRATQPRFTPESLRALRTCNPHISRARAAGELAYRPRPLADTIRDTLAWFAGKGLLRRP